MTDDPAIKTSVPIYGGVTAPENNGRRFVCDMK